MKTLRELYRTGVGPSSSHTMAPRVAALRFVDHHAGADHDRVALGVSWIIRKLLAAARIHDDCAEIERDGF